MSSFVNKYADLVTKKQAMEQDHCLIISGSTGQGKSHLAMDLLKAHSPKSGIDNVSLDALQMADSMKKFLRTQGTCLVFDEAIQIGSRRSTSSLNVAFGELMDVIRGLRWFTIFCLPKPHDLERKIRNRAHALIYVKQRGRGSLWLGQSQITQVIARGYKEGYAHIPGQWEFTFGEYTGDLIEPYKVKKDKRMASGVEIFYNTIHNIYDKLKGNVENDLVEKDGKMYRRQ